ncbi:RNA polymerase sigma factor [Nocardioides speluncae]|uniref:RNA polymerase sigma factor n=1 Tax=Nocardioides speluncae TaxID=2670337 RepID=UPI001980DBC6|nr:sigma-70 family RNA polymerase sigma factor [Nocardioides speluncae]
MSGERFEDVWRREVPHVLAALTRRYGDFDGAEDAVQEALATAAREWPRTGPPDSPRSWLVRVASRRLVDAWRSDLARSAREQAYTAREDGPPPEAQAADDSLQLLLLCCHPALPRASQVALTLRAVGGLTTQQIAAAFLVPTATMAQRVSRAKAALRSNGAHFDQLPAAELPARLAAVQQVLYLVFNEGYTSSGGDHLLDVSLTREAIRLTRELRARLPDDPEVAGLLALMLLTDARSAARTDARGDLIPLERQDRSRWDRDAVAEGVALVQAALPDGTVGPFQLQAAIAAVHAEATTSAETDWLQITMLYRMLARVAPGPMVTLNLAVATGMAHGAAAGLAVVEPLRTDPALARNHRLPAVRAHLLELAGQPDEARAEYAAAARLTTSVPEQRYLNARASSLAER